MHSHESARCYQGAIDYVMLCGDPELKWSLAIIPSIPLQVLCTLQKPWCPWINIQDSIFMMEMLCSRYGNVNLRFSWLVQSMIWSDLQCRWRIPSFTYTRASYFSTLLPLKTSWQYPLAYQMMDWRTTLSNLRQSHRPSLHSSVLGYTICKCH